MATNNPFLKHPPLKPVYKSAEDEMRANELFQKARKYSNDPIYISEYLAEAARLGHPEAMYRLSEYYRKTFFLPWDPVVKSLVERAALGGYKYAISAQYDAHQTGKYGLQWFILALEYDAISDYRIPDAFKYFLQEKKMTLQYGIKLLYHAAKYWNNMGAKKFFMPHKPIHKNIYGIHLIPIEDYLSFAKDVRNDELKLYRKSFETAKQYLPKDELQWEMMEPSEEACKAYAEGYYLEQCDHYLEAVEQYKQAAEDGHAIAAWRLVSLLPFLRGTSQEEIEKWRQMAEDWGYPMAINDVHAIFRLAETGNSEALEYLEHYFKDIEKREQQIANENVAKQTTRQDALRVRKASYKKLDELGDLSRDFRRAKREVCNAVPDVEHVCRLIELEGGFEDEGGWELARHYRYNILLWGRLHHMYESDLSKVPLEKLDRLAKSGLDCKKLYEKRASWIAYERRERLQQLEYQREIMEEELAEQRELARERAREMQAYREKLDHEERIRNVMFTGSADTNFESYVMGIQSADQYYVNEMLREEKEKKFKNSLAD